MKAKNALWLALCMCLLSACAHADALAATEDAAALATAQESGQTLRALRQEQDDHVQQLDEDEGKKQSEQLRQGAAQKDKNQQALGGKLVDRSDGHAVHRVYDPISGLFCELVGDCHPCPVSEKDEVFCRETGHRQELLCPRSPENKTPATDAQSLQEVRFKACLPTEKANPLLSVLLFEFVMAGALAGAFVLLRKEQQNHLSSFDLRKDPRQRGALLGSGAPKGAD